MRKARHPAARVVAIIIVVVAALFVDVLSCYVNGGIAAVKVYFVGMHHLAYVVMEVVLLVSGGLLAQCDSEAIALGEECCVVHLGLEVEGLFPLA